MGHGRPGLVALAGAIAVEGCVPSPVAPTAACADCHSAAAEGPWVGLGGLTDPAAIGVGAHLAHLAPASADVPASGCDDCHLVPTTVDSEGHLDTPWPAEVAWGASPTDGASLPWDHADPTCTVACHGATLTGGSNPTPTWNADPPEEMGCGSCHGDPPPPPHGADADCATCHGPLDPSTHLDGDVDTVDGAGCEGCHGEGPDLSPPLDTEGNADRSARGVGAHDFHEGEACTTCHLVPSSPDAPGHIDPAPAEVVFGGLAVAGGAAPAWDPVGLTCAGTYCHGGTLTGGTDPTVSWVGTDLVISCTSCHGNPPPPPHTVNTECSTCHSPFSAGTHQDGELQTELADCGGCHGESADDLDPPPDLEGNTDTDRVTVGAHQSHGVCGACHVVPERWRDAGHIDPAPSEVVFDLLALADGASPTWDRAAMTCAGTYCHGATLSGGAHTTPDWTLIDGSQVTCGSCHGAPPPPPHPGLTDCLLCHPDVTAGQHRNGALDVL